MRTIEKKAWEMRNELVSIVLNCSPFQVPEKGNCSGSSGKATEVAVKCELGCYKSAAEGVADIGKTDMVKYGIDPQTGKKRRYLFEIKTRNGTIGVPTPKGYKWIYEKADFIVYFINKSDFSQPLYSQCLVIPATDFHSALVANNLYHYHYKKGTPKPLRTPENSYKCNIQQFDNSAPRRTAWEKDITFLGMDWELFAEIYGIKW